jgi:hypothetical protein
MLLHALVLIATTSGATPAPKAADCYCTDGEGRRVEMGERICLTVDGRSFTAECGMSLNSPAWRKVADGCLSS